MSEKPYKLTLELSDQSMIGEMNGYRFSVTSVKLGLSTYDAVTFSFEHGIDKATIQEIKKSLKLRPIKSTFLHPNDQLIFLFRVSKDQSFGSQRERLEERLSEFVHYLSERFVKQEQRCVICRLEIKEEVVGKLWGNTYVHVHPSCAKTHMYEAQKEMEKENKKIFRLPFSIVLSFIGAVIGTAPIIILLLTTNKYISVLYSIVPFCAYIGFKLGKAPRKKYMLWVVIAMSLSVVSMMVLYRWHIESISVGTTLATLLSYGAGIGLVLSDLVVSFLFTGIGFFLFWKILLKATDSSSIEIEKL